MTKKTPRPRKGAGKAKAEAAKQSVELPVPRPAGEPTPIVGIGASAGGLEAFTRLLGALPVDTGLAFVLVQHLAPTHKSALTPLLARATRMPVQEVRDGMQVEPNHVYVIPANADLSLLDGLLHIVGRKAPAGRHLPIDYFFTSLAESRGPQSIGVILSGAASGGTAGIKAIKAAGGFTFAQDPETAKFDGMPRSAIASGYVDLVLSPERIAKDLARIVRHRFAGIVNFHEVPAVPAGDEDWAQLFRILRTATGVDFTSYKKSTVKRRLARRMAVCKTDDLRTYLKLLQGNQAEVEALFDELLILVTDFFRDPDVFLALERKIFPPMLAGRAPGEPIRIWVAGCSTGQEAYSLAISLLQCTGDGATGTQIQIFGTDVCEKAIEEARVGIYSAPDLKGVPQVRLRRYFTPVNGSFQVNEAVRDLCVFARHDLARDPPFSKLDLISCRNVLIYMEPALQKRILASFHYGLRPNGILVLGKSESLGAFTDVFTAKDRQHKFFKRNEGAHAPIALGRLPNEQALPAKAAKENAANADLEREATQMVWERYAHAGLVVNSDLQIVHFLGDISSYVRHAPGRASFQLLRSLREEFVLEVRAALQKARRGRAAVRREGIEYRRNGHTAGANIEVRPLLNVGPERSFLILFESATAPSEDSGDAPKNRKRGGQSDRKVRDQEISRLRDELARTRDYVQAIIRDQEATNEELKASNEEALSRMEELQSTNEELEIAKEELQSSNKELITLNQQLQNRNTELSQLSTDLGNVLNGVDIPVVILSVDRRIRRYTPPAEKLLGLIPGDIGRPIGKLRIGVNVPTLDDLIANAVKKRKVEARELQSESGRWYSLRIRPFVVGEAKVQGVLMAFVDIHGMKILQQEAMVRAEQSESTARALLESASQAILACDENGEIRLANGSAGQMFGYPRELLIGRKLETLMPQRFRTIHAQHRRQWFAQPHPGPMAIGLELAGLRQDGTEFPMEVSTSFIRAHKRILGVAFITDIKDRKQFEQALQESSAQLTAHVSALDRLRLVNAELWRCHDLREGLERMLDAGIDLLGAQMGSIQLFNPDTHVPEMLVHRGVGPEQVGVLHEIAASGFSAIRRSLAEGRRIVIEDVNEDQQYLPLRAAAAAAGYRAVQSTLVRGTDLQPLCIFSTCFRNPHRPSDIDLMRFDLYAAEAAQFIERLKAEKKLRELSRSLMLAQEDANRVIARQLHDDFSQEMLGLSMEISSLGKDPSFGKDPVSATRRNAQMVELAKRIDALAKRLHQTSRRLHPSVLDELGLEAALRSECESFQAASGIPTDCNITRLPAGLPPDVSLCLYRVVQECLRNIQKHAQNTVKVWVSLKSSSNAITLTVKDKGNGFELVEAIRKGGLGLISIRERVEAEDGLLTIESEPGVGTTITASIPLTET